MEQGGFGKKSTDHRLHYIKSPRVKVVFNLSLSLFKKVSALVVVSSNEKNRIKIIVHKVR